MKTAKTRLIVAVVALVAALAMMSTITYAWFAMNDTTSVSNFNLTVTSQDGLYTSATEDGTYSITMTAPTLAGKMGACTVARDAGNLENAATAFSLVDLSNTAAQDATATANNTGYYKFTDYFRSFSAYTVGVQSVTVTGNGDSKVIAAPRTFSAAETGDAEVLEGGDMQANAENAVRVAVVAGATVEKYNPNATAGDFNAWTVNPAHEVYKSLLGANSLDGKIVTDLTDYTTTGSPTLLTLEAPGLNETYYTGSVDVYVWMEGTDKDCFSSILGDSISVALTFHGTAVNA